MIAYRIAIKRLMGHIETYRNYIIYKTTHKYFNLYFSFFAIFMIEMIILIKNKEKIVLVYNS